MTIHNNAARTELSHRVDTIGWGLLFVATGAVSLMPSMPDGAWLIVAGLAMLGASAVRAWLHLPLWGLTIVIGIVALAAGIFTVAGLTTAVGPLVLIVLGLTLILGALYRTQRGSAGASFARTN